MTDDFPIIPNNQSNKRKISLVSEKEGNSPIIEKINLMLPTTLYIAVQGTVVPTLDRLSKIFFYYNDFSSATNSKSSILLPAAASKEGSFIEMSRSLNKIKTDLQDIQNRIKELQKNAKKILELRIDPNKEDTKITRENLWTYPDDEKFWNDPESHGGIFGRFFALKGVLEKKIASLEKEIKIVENNLSNDSLVKKLKETLKNLKNQIPPSSNKWNTKEWTYDGLAWKFKWNLGNIWWVAWDERSQNKGSPNSTGFLDLVQNKEKCNNYIQNLEKGIKSIHEFTSTKEFHLLQLKNLDTQSAYLYLITVFLPFLQNQASISLDKHGKTMELISTVFDHWNEIQNEITKVTQNSKEIHQWIKEGKVDSNYNLYKDNNYKEKETDPDKLAKWNPFKSLLSTLQNKQTQLGKLLDDMEKRLPDSMKSLISTMKTLTTKILEIPITQEARDLSSFLKVLEKSPKELEMLSEIENLTNENTELEKKKKKAKNSMSYYEKMLGDHMDLDDDFLKLVFPKSYLRKQHWNEAYREYHDIDKKMKINKEKIERKNKELLQMEKEKVKEPDKRLTLLSWMINSDQTQFKSYMDILAQGVTALTSVSNMIQQLLQIDTQYYNSLLGLQKAGQDTLNKTIQSIMNNMR